MKRTLLVTVIIMALLMTGCGESLELVTKDSVDPEWEWVDNTGKASEHHGLIFTTEDKKASYTCEVGPFKLYGYYPVIHTEDMLYITDSDYMQYIGNGTSASIHVEFDNSTYTPEDILENPELLTTFGINEKLINTSDVHKKIVKSENYDNTYETAYCWERDSYPDYFVKTYIVVKENCVYTIITPSINANSSRTTSNSLDLTDDVIRDWVDYIIDTINSTNVVILES